MNQDEETLLPCEQECPLLADRIGQAWRSAQEFSCQTIAKHEKIPFTSIESISDGVAEDGRLCMLVMQADRVRIDFSGPRLVTNSEHCEVMGGSTPLATIDRFGSDIEFQSQTFRAGQPLVALAQGKGEQRATPAYDVFLALDSWF